MLHDNILNQFKEHSTYIKYRQNPLRGQPGCYYILHLNSKFMYIGSTKSLGDRIHGHMTALKYNKHKNKNLQNLYKEDNKINIFVQPTKTLEEAQHLEQELVTKYKNSGFLCNIATDDVLLTGLNRKLTEHHKQILLKASLGKLRSEEAKINMSNAQKQFLNTEQGKLLFQQKIDKISRKITIDGKEYNSISDASRQLNIPYTSLVRKYGIQPRRKDN